MISFYKIIGIILFIILLSIFFIPLALPTTNQVAQTLVKNPDHWEIKILDETGLKFSGNKKILKDFLLLHLEQTVTIFFNFNNFFWCATTALIFSLIGFFRERNLIKKHETTHK